MHPIPKLFGALVCCALLLAAHPVVAAADAASLRAALAAERARPVAPLLPRAAFIAPPAVQSVHLSPDGRHVAWLREHEQVRSVWLMPTAGGPARRLLPRTEANQLHWSRDGQWLFATGR